MSTQTETPQAPPTLAELNALSDQAEAITPDSLAIGRMMVDSVNPYAIHHAIQSGAIKPNLVAGYPHFGWTSEDFQLLHLNNYNTVRITHRNPCALRHLSLGDSDTGR